VRYRVDRDVTSPRDPGQLLPGDIIQLTDPKGHPHTITLEPGKMFHTHRGGLSHDEIMACGEGAVVSSTGGTAYVVLRSRLEDFTLAMPRGATVIYPKDSARIVAACGLREGSRVVEAGAGSGALTCALLTAVGARGSVVSFERRADFAATAQANVTSWFGQLPSNWQLEVADLSTVGGGDAGANEDAVASPDDKERPRLIDEERPFDAVVLDMLAPWECLGAARRLLRPGGVLVGYVATTTQLSRLAESLRLEGCWTEPRAEESMVRTWHLEGLAVRPDHRMIGHTGFLLITRRLADGTVAPPRRTRPAKGAYGEDYTPPGGQTRDSSQADESPGT
jgi:tRNA (adenine57-N1/adenine58-N1)-methyltransferase